MPKVILRYWKNYREEDRSHISLQTSESYFSESLGNWTRDPIGPDEIYQQVPQEELSIEVDNGQLKKINGFIALFKRHSVAEYEYPTAVLFLLHLTEIFSKIESSAMSKHESSILRNLYGSSSILKSLKESDGIRSYCKHISNTSLKNVTVTPELVMTLVRPLAKTHYKSTLQTSYRELSPLLLCFYRIYKALREGQSGFFKTDFLKGKENLKEHALIKEINDHIKKNPHSRTQKAWELANLYVNRHYEDEDDDLSDELFNTIYKWSFEKSGIFKQSKISGTSYYTSASYVKNVNTLAKATIKSIEDNDTRSAKIMRCLRF